MIVDASAIVAIIFQERGHEQLIDALLERGPAGISAPTLLEASIVTTARLQKDSSALISRIIAEFDITTVSFGEEHAQAAFRAWLRFGKGRHRAALNFGDCIAYAVAKLSKEPLLCIGRDFAETDLDILP